ncbi:hypothetical protein DFS34DRAFT_648488 [Phlyctochytrium arcticum]|nr:hypothetical protein DFS34DRAFT_648488 [Phlyctochytrium arcticum]
MATTAIQLTPGTHALEPSSEAHESRPETFSNPSSIPRSGSGLPSQVSDNDTSLIENAQQLKQLVLQWMEKFLIRSGEPPESIGGDQLRWNELRYGQIPCRLINILLPNGVRHINLERNPIAAVENLGAFYQGKQTTVAFGVEKKYNFRPLDFVKGNTHGDENMVRVLAALVIYAGQERGIYINEISIDKMRQYLDGMKVESGREGTQSVAIDGGDGGGITEAVDRILAKLKNASAGQTLRRAAAAEIKLRQTLLEILEPNSQLESEKDIQSAIIGGEANIDDFSGTLTRLLDVLKDLEVMQQSVMNRVAGTGLADRMALIDAESLWSEPDSRRMFPDSEVQKMESSFSMTMEPGDHTRSRTQTEISTSGVQSTIPTGPPRTMFAKLPPEVAASNLSKAEMMRLCSVYELIETEADYVRDLTLMINFHKTQLQATQILTDEEIDLLFSNIDQLVPVNQQLLDRLHEKRDSDPFIPEVGDALVDVSDSFRVYTTYCGNYPEAMKLVHKLQARADMKEKLETMMNSPEGRGLSLESFLIKPVQRICKYPLLIRELQKHTDKLSKDTISLNLAMTKIESVVTLVNEYTRQLGERDRLMALQGRIDSPTPLNFHEKKHVRDGVVTRAINGKPRERHALLFTDVLLICTPVKAGRYLLESVHDVTDLSLKTDSKGEGVPKGMKNAFIVANASDRKDLVFATISDDDRQKWLDAFTTAIRVANEESKKMDINKRMSSGAFLAQQFHNGQEDGDRLNNRGAWGMNRRMPRPQSTMGVGGSLRGTLKGWSTLRKKDIDFAGMSQSSMDPSGTNYADSEPMEQEPEMVEINGQIWRRTMSAMGLSYYFNVETKESSWRLQDGYTVLDPDTGKPYPETADEEDNFDESGVDGSVEEAESGTVEPVDGHPNWRRVDKRDEVYFYNVVTQETKWAID